jgi:hypothetical protein
MVELKKLSRNKPKRQTKKLSKNNKQNRINYKSKPNFFINPPRLILIK